jgi:hypothetical protein
METHPSSESLYSLEYNNIQKSINTKSLTAWTGRFHHNVLAKTGKGICSQSMVFQFCVKGLPVGYQTLALDIIINLRPFHQMLPVAV